MLVISSGSLQARSQYYLLETFGLSNQSGGSLEVLFLKKTYEKQKIYN